MRGVGVRGVSDLGRSSAMGDGLPGRQFWHRCCATVRFDCDNLGSQAGELVDCALVGRERSAPGDEEPGQLSVRMTALGR